jgi:hypothetical protein
MYDARNSSPSGRESRRSLGEKLTLKRLVSITAVLVTLSLLMSWPPVSSSSANYSPWNKDQLGLMNAGVAVALGNSAPTITSAAPTFTSVDPALSMPTPTVIGALQPDTQLDSFTLTVDDGLYADQRDALADDLKQALDYVMKRFGSSPSGHFNAVIAREDSCNLHGVAHTEERTVQVSTCNSIARDRAVAIMAHEFVHQLAQDRYGPAHLSADLILAEGVATWGAGEYWLGGQPDFRAYVRGQRASGVFFPLATDYTGKGIGAMNALYYQWASFVDFLITTYGREKFDQVYVAGQGAPGSADYRGVYGKGLDVLEQEWQAWLDE